MGLVLAGCGTDADDRAGEDEPIAATSSSTSSTTSSSTTTTARAPVTTRRPAATTVAPVTTRPASGASGPAGGAAGVAPGEHLGMMRLGPNLGVCAGWEEELRKPPPDAPPSYPDTLRTRLRERDCPGW